MLHATAVLDANLLMTRYLRDLMLSLAERALYRPRWSPELLVEMRRAIRRRAGEAWDAPRADRIERTIELMNRAFPDANVYGYTDLIHTLRLPDPDDRHVLAAAITGNADVIVTINLTDFPAAALAPYGIEALHPDAFVRGLFDAAPDNVVAAIETMTKRWRKPEVHAAQALEQYRTRWGPLPRSMALLQAYLDRSEEE